MMECVAVMFGFHSFTEKTAATVVVWAARARRSRDIVRNLDGILVMLDDTIAAELTPGGQGGSSTYLLASTHRLSLT